jgi:5-methylcytosine-specific restriction enzyme subunit McrC
MYIKEVQTLVKHGIKSSYITVEDNLTFFKGKLNVSQNIKTNLAHKERFYMSYDEYSVNRPENRLIKSTLLKLMRKSSNNQNIKEIRRLLTIFEFVDESTNYERDFASIVIEHNMKDYETLLIWSKIFLYNKSLTTFSGKTLGTALLFPMEKVFEQYVAKWVRNIFGENGWTVTTQDRTYHLFDTPEPHFLLKPDIVITKEDQTIIMDTKWKQLSYDLQHNYGISQADMYQMYVYSMKYRSNKPDGKPAPVWLLYPKNKESDNIGEPVFSSNDGVTVHIYFVDVDKIEESIKELLENI